MRMKRLDSVRGIFASVAVLLGGSAHATLISVGTTSDVFSSNATTCSLRAAFYAASNHIAFGGCAAGNGSDTILIPAGTYAVTLAPVATHPEQGGAFYLHSQAGDTTAIASTGGAGAAVLDGSGLDAVLDIAPASGSTALILGLTIRGGESSKQCYAAGLNFDCFTNTADATLSMSDTWITANHGSGFHGRHGNVNMSRVSITGNDGTGAILEDTVTSMLEDVTISRNVGGANNSSSSYDGPGGLRIDGATGVTTIANSTIAYNSFVDSNSNDYNELSSGGIAVRGAPTPVVNLRNSIIANNVRGDRSLGADCRGFINSQGYNLLGDTNSCGISGVTATNLVNTNPQLAPLFDYGHALPTHLLRPGSPAIGTGNPAAPGSGGTACARYDGRDFDRTIAGGLCDIGAYQSHTDYNVSTTVDANDANPNDNFCVATSGGCSLRAAITQANSASTFKTIRLPAGRFKMTLAPVYNFIDNLSGTFAVLSPSAVTIIGAGAGKTIIDGNGLDRVFTLYTNSGAESAVSLHDLTISGGNDLYAAGGGGAIGTDDDLLLDRVTIENNRAPYGGGLVAESSSRVVIDASALIDNSSTGANIGGGAIFADAGASLQITNSTIAQNSSGALGGGIVIFNGAQVSLAFDTITRNRAANGGGGIAYSASGTYFIRDSIIANNSDASAQAPDCLANVQIADWTFLRNTSGCSIGGAQSTLVISNQDPGLTGLTYQGGPTPTSGLAAYSAARGLLQGEYECVDSDAVPVVLDQRGSTRPTTYFGQPANGGFCDIGAFQGTSDVIFADHFQ
jgi:CSLREA domain-containing protein